MHLDPLEILLYMLLMLPAGVAIKEAFAPSYTFEQAIGRTGAIAGALVGIRKLNTQGLYELIVSSDKKT